ncbi:patatin-like phospholipase family protein [Chryseolinea sp. T2]|uniref:patatin-like phospholipase family protein n=1 Tax=Chryseolinea sp. T2 TaxID=3129255 RepID=UPI003077A033
MLCKRTHCYLLILVLVLSCAGQRSLLAQHRPKVGLVLSGGGAKGIAHIGILKALEEAGLTPDYIAGTSMGSIIGGMYAAGYKADELHDIIADVDWDALLSNKVPMNEVVFEEKHFANRYLLDFYFQKNKLIIPKGIIEGERLIRLFSELTRGVHGLDFDQLPIPFACVATDIVNGKSVVLRKGSLAMAMRASMSIPSIFTPVTIDGKLLVDGGVLENLPVSTVLEMGADIVIAVNVSLGLEAEDQLNTPISIITQTAFITAAHEAELEAKKANILIQPDLTGFSTGSFNMAAEILDRGDDAGRKYVQQFKRLADSLNRFGPSREMVHPKSEPTYQFAEVQVDGVDDVQQKNFIAGKLNISPQRAISITELEHRFATLYATRYYQRIWYEILGTADHRILLVHATENPQTQFRFSYHYDSENKGGIVLNATIRNKLLQRSRLIAEADLATFPRVMLDYFKYLGKRQNLAAQITGFFNVNELPILTERGDELGSFSSRYYSATARLQTATFLNGTFGIEGMLTHLYLKPKVADVPYRDINWINYNHLTFALYYKFDNTNDRYFPVKGMRVDIRAAATPRAYGSFQFADSIHAELKDLGDAFYSDDIYSAAATIEPFIPLSHRFTILSKLRYRISSLPDDAINFDNKDYIGGFIPNLINSQEYYGAKPKEFIAASYLYGRVGLHYQILSKLFAGLHYNFLSANPKDDEPVFSGKNFRQAFAASLGYASPIGPLKVYLAKDPDRNSWEASLAIGFYY